MNTLLPGGTVESPFLSTVPANWKRFPDRPLYAQESLTSAEAFVRAGKDVQVSVPICVPAASLLAAAQRKSAALAILILFASVMIGPFSLVNGLVAGAFREKPRFAAFMTRRAREQG
jgi:hypothetical protein